METWYLNSDNGSPFNSLEIKEFAENRNIHLQKIPPRHPVANPAETFTRPLGKTMKIAHYHSIKEGDALQQLLHNYRDTTHPATGLVLGAMMFLDGYRSIFPRVAVEDKVIRIQNRKDRIR